MRGVIKMNSIRRLKEGSDKIIGLYIQQVENNVNTHWHEHYEITLCTGGSGYSIINGKKTHIKKGSLFLLTPSDFHSIEVISTLNLIILTFSIALFPYSSLTEILYSVTCKFVDLTDSEYNDVLFYIDKIKSELSNNNSYSHTYMKNIFSCILIDLLRHADTNQTPLYPTKISKILYYINCHFKEDISLRDVADFTQISYSNIGKYIKKHLNVSFPEYLNTVRLEYSCRLLLNSTESISDIAYFSGFTSVAHFSKAFKNKYKITPHEYRKHNKDSLV